LAAQTDIQNLRQVQRLFPEAAGQDQLVVDMGDIVDQDVEPALLFLDLLEQRLDLGVVGMVDAHGNACAAGGLVTASAVS
jgi:hypothetical protein